MSKSQAADASEPDAEMTQAVDDTKEEEDETLTAADQLAPLQVGMPNAAPFGIIVQSPGGQCCCCYSI